MIISDALADDLYQVSLLATDNEGKDSALFYSSIRVGPPPAPAAPELSNITVSVSGQCATVSGNVTDINDDLTLVSIAFANGNISAVIEQTSYSATQCSLPGGNNTASVTASDQAAQTSNDSITFMRQTISRKALMKPCPVQLMGLVFFTLLVMLSGL
jgi:poly(3-hydroxybutyrate) depolymerase